MQAKVERREVGNELLPLLVLGLTSMALVLGMAYAVQEPDTARSVALSTQVVLVGLGLGIVAMALIHVARGRPKDVIVEPGPDGLRIDGALKIPRRAIRWVFVLREGDFHSVEIERLTGTTRLLTTDRETAERIAGALTGRERKATAYYRLRKKANYYLFATTCSVWVLVYAGLVAFAYAPVAGLLILLFTLPPAIWVALKAVPTHVIVEPDDVALLHPLRKQVIPAEQIAGGRVVDDDTVRLDFTNGDSLRLDELADHPRDREARTSAPPAERFEASLEALVGRA